MISTRLALSRFRDVADFLPRWAELQLVDFSPAGQAHQLMAQANAEDGNFPQQPANGFDGIVERALDRRGRIGQEDAIGLG